MKTYLTNTANRYGIGRDGACIGITIQTPQGVARMAICSQGAFLLGDELIDTLAVQQGFDDALLAIRYAASLGGYQKSGNEAGYAWGAERCWDGASVWMTARSNNISIDQAREALK